MELPTLYSKSSTGKVKVWSVKVEPAGKAYDIITTYGYLDGKMQETKTRITTGKNIGKANETTPQQQAESEARSKWNKKKDEGYYDGNMAPLTTILPMLALDFHQRGHDIKFPCYVQPKLDGVRCVYKDGVMTSRLGKPFSGLEHIKDELAGSKLVLDGELYSDTLGFQEIVGLVKKGNPDPAKALQIKYVLYDVVSDDAYSQRLALLNAFPNFKHVHVLKTEVCTSLDNVKQFHDKYVGEGYEGLILRNMRGGYKVKHRSKDLQKYKEFQDAEFEIVGFTQGVGNEAGLVIWECKTKDGKQFSVRPGGTWEERAGLFKHGSRYIGKKLTVKFQEYTTDGIPRFPTTLHGGEGDIRDFE